MCYSIPEFEDSAPMNLFLRASNLFRIFLESVLSETLCLACGREAHDPLHDACARTLAWRIDCRFDWIYSCLPYRNNLVKKIILYQKSNRIDRLPIIFSKIIAQALLNIAEQNNFTEIFLVPIPARSARIIEFGFNQALVLSEFIAQQSDDIHVANILNRNPSANTKQAWAENRQARITSIAGSFYIDPEINQNKNALYILIDDVSTTGATLAESRRVLHAFGIENILGFTLAH
jgi:predicted amidophosphoribosyltransferase